MLTEIIHFIEFVCSDSGDCVNLTQNYFSLILIRIRYSVIYLSDEKISIDINLFVIVQFNRT